MTREEIQRSIGASAFIEPSDAGLMMATMARMLLEIHEACDRHYNKSTGKVSSERDNDALVYEITRILGR